MSAFASCVIADVVVVESLHKIRSLWKGNENGQDDKLCKEVYDCYHVFEMSISDLLCVFSVMLFGGDSSPRSWFYFINHADL